MNVCAHRPLVGGVACCPHSVWFAGRIAMVLVLAFGLNGCSLWVRTLNGNAQLLVSAQPLAVSDPKSKDNQVLREEIEGKDDKAKLAFLGRVVLDSETKCQSFINGLVIAENTVNTTGDITSTVLTGLASVFKPLTTVHGLTAASTVVTGSKASINANIYAKASIVNFQAALTQTYAQAIKDYTDELPHLTQVIVSNEVSKIQAIHGTCTLAATETTILSKISSPGPGSLTVPAKPTGLAAKPLNGGVELTWTLVPGAATYSIFQGTASEAEADAPVKSDITKPPYTVVDLENDKPFFFKVAAQNAAGSGPKSDEVTATPSASITEVATAPPAETHAPVPGKAPQ
jgi:hypothetical protein